MRGNVIKFYIISLNYDFLFISVLLNSFIDETTEKFSKISEFTQLIDGRAQFSHYY